MLLYLRLICLASMVACMYLLWQMATQPETRGPDWILLTFGVVWVPGMLAYGARVLRAEAGGTA
ncbi:hypothetical protein [Deinococcus sp. 23YEL01]|uniref:hypothetical protein n=1 Tax=Deinococcus sp. 23YEL01 TaxID=2745871 RepID=UPI001E5A4E67|nr:hypothetical protein [Deinococcus sp. 23YEL01]MCD0168051.1 hypothetical protein [Deinococcus sp. 23YEL01]